MNKIRPNDTRYEIIKKFDDCMDEFFARTIGFCEEITRIAESDESNMKINTLALNLLEDLNLITQNAEFYENEIKWSMLDIRFDKHEEYKSKMEKDLIDFKHKVNDIIGNGGIGNDYEEFKVEQNSVNENNAIVLSETGRISKQMADYGVLFFSQILQKVQKLELMFSGLIALNVSRTESDYMEIYNRTREKYESQSEYKEFRDSYIKNTIELKFDGKLINPMQIESLIHQRNLDAMYDNDIGTIWSSSRNDPVKATKLFIERRLLHDREILKFLRFIVEIDLLEEYKLYANKNIFNIGKGSVQSDRIQFYAPYSVSRLRSQWTDIHAIMDGNNAKSWEWCALHHALSIQQKINNVDFYTFMKWIKKEFNEEYITSANYKNYKYDYFVMNNQEEWNIKKYREYYLSRQNPKQRGKTFGVKQINAFNRVFDNIYIPLLKVIAK